LEQSSIRGAIWHYIVEKLLAGDAAGLADNTDLFTTGVLDSFTTLELTLFLQETFHRDLSLAQIDAGRLRSLDSICRLVEETLARG